MKLCLAMAAAAGGGPGASAAPTRVENGYAAVNGLEMYYEIHGAGRALVLLHGGGSTIETTFGKVLPSLVRSRQIIGVEQQGHGRTADIDRPLTFEQMADDTAALLRHLQIERADVLGFSNGANVALQIAIRHPDLVRKIVVASGFFRSDGLAPELREMFKHATADNMPAALRDAYVEVAPDPERLPTLVAKLMQMLSGFEDIRPEEMRRVAAPAMVMIGDADIVRPEHAVEMFRLLPNARLAVLPGADHGGYLGEVTAADRDSHLPDLTVRLIEAFLDAPMPDGR
jgi:pimeloyl-ACP methyl ester carboxylesterase